MTVEPHHLAATHAAAFADRRAWTAQEFSSLLAKPGVILCGDAKSFLLGRVVADEAEVLTIATQPAFQRQGRARKHLRDFLAQAQSQGATRAFLEVADNNAPAKSLYQKDNFQVVALRSGYYTASSGEKVSALIMECALNSAPSGPSD